MDIVISAALALFLAIVTIPLLLPYFTSPLRPWPLLGSLPQLLSNIPRLHDYITELAARYRTFRLPMPAGTLIFTADPAVVEHLLKTNFSNYGKGRQIHAINLELFGNGIFNVDGVEWKRQRKTASLEFSSRLLKNNTLDSFRHYASKLAEILRHESEAGRPVELQTMLQRMTLGAMFEIGFGTKLDSLSLTPAPEAIAFTDAFDYASTHSMKRILLDPFWKIKKYFGVGSEKTLQQQIKVMDNLAYRVIKQRKEEMHGQRWNGKADLLSRFLTLAEADPEYYTDKTLRDLALNFLLAGRDTTAITLCWFFYALTQNPEVEKKVLHEIVALQMPEDSLCLNDNPIDIFASVLNFETLAKMNYLQACLSETLRLYPAIPMDAKVAFDKDVLPDGTKVKAGDMVFYLPYAMGRMEWIWGEDAGEFKPERWLSDGAYVQQSPFKFTAFQAGPRLCMGKDFAYVQMKITAAILLRFFKFEVVRGHMVHYRLMLTLHMSKEGLQVNVLPRYM